MGALKTWGVLLALVAGSAAPAMAQDGGARAQARQVLARFSSEPTVVAVQNAAARYAQVNPGAYASWMSASNLAALLPKNLRARYRHTADDGTDVRTSSGSISDLLTQDAEDLIEFYADWDLTKLVFNRDSVTAARQIERIVNQREDILTTVNKLYFARRQLQVDMELEPPTSVDRALKMQLRIEAITADLDALTGGWFSKQLPAER